MLHSNCPFLTPVTDLEEGIYWFSGCPAMAGHCLVFLDICGLMVAGTMVLTPLSFLRATYFGKPLQLTKWLSSNSFSVSLQALGIIIHGANAS